MRIAIYPGTFDPVTNGHLDILCRAVKFFDRIVVGIAADNNKKPLFTLSEREELVREAVRDSKIRNIEVSSFTGLTIDFARKCGASAIIRGLRALTDFEYEFQLALMNKKLDSSIETVFLMTQSEYSFISSSIVKSAASLGAGISEFVPRNVEKALFAKYNKIV